jgi:L-lactate dehydrogenase complex protein LldE
MFAPLNMTANHPRQADKKSLFQRSVLVSVQPRRVALFVTCIVDQVYPNVGMAAARLLEACGCDVFVPRGLTCCGQMGFNAGFRAEARAVAGRAVELLRMPKGWKGDIVMPSGSCAAMVRHMYAELFDGTRHAPAAADLAGRTYELTEYLVDVLGVEDLGARYDGRIAYHDACHGLRFLGLGRQARALLAHVAGAELVALPADDQCCGFGGLFAIKQRAISEAMLGRKLAAVRAADADLLVTGDVSCMTQIAGGLSRAGSATKAYHIAEVLANMVDRRAM